MLPCWPIFTMGVKMDISVRNFLCPKKGHYYVARIVKDLMDDIVVKFEWGGEIKSGGTKTLFVETIGEAMDIIEKKARTLTTRHRGYHEVN